MGDAGRLKCFFLDFTRDQGTEDELWDLVDHLMDEMGERMSAPAQQ